MGRIFGGRVYKDGFEIIDRKNLIRVRKNKDGIFSKKIHPKNKKIPLLFLIFVGGFLVIFFISFWFSQNIWLAFQIGIIFWVLFNFSLFTYVGVRAIKIKKEEREIRRDKSFPIVKQWHACEHKLIYLLENEKEVTLGSLKSAPMISSHCGAETRGSNQSDWLAEPTEEQLKVTLEVAKEYFRVRSTLN